MRAVIKRRRSGERVDALVGAAGFEPATWSTQNSRATRLRYAPPSVAAFDTRFDSNQQAALAAAKYRMPHAIARGEAEFLRRAADDLEHGPRRTAGADHPRGERFGILGNPQDPSVAADEDHVERNIGVLHPHRYFLLAHEVEQHPAAFRQFAPVHETAGALLVVDRELHRKDMNAVSADDLDRLFGAGRAPIGRCRETN